MNLIALFDPEDKMVASLAFHAKETGSIPVWITTPRSRETQKVG